MKMASDHFIREQQGRNSESILRTGKHTSRTKQWRRAQRTCVSCGSPRTSLPNGTRFSSRQNRLNGSVANRQLHALLGSLALMTEPPASQESARERRALKACWHSAKDTAEPENNYGTKAGKKRKPESRLARRGLADLHAPNLAITLAGKPTRPNKQPPRPCSQKEIDRR